MRTPSCWVSQNKPGHSFCATSRRASLRITGFVGATPTLRFLGKANHVSDRYGEKLNARHVERVLETLLADVRHRFCLLAPDRPDDRLCYTLFIESDNELSTDFAKQLDIGLRENPHYKLCVELGQLSPARLFRVSRHGLRSYEARLVASGLRQGDVKPTSLSTIDGWSSHFDGEYTADG